jgi:small subunit ribosomal protein S16
MVRIRLRRVGAKNQPSYRIVVTDSRSPRDGRFIEKIGFYNPRTEPATMVLDEARALHWLSHGAQPSDAVRHIMTKLGTSERFARLRAGEAVDDLIAEAEAGAATREAVDPRTRRDDLQSRPKKKAKVEEVEAEAEVEVEAEAEPEGEEVEAEVEEAEAEAEVEIEAEAEVEEAEAEVEVEIEAEVEETEAEVEEAETEVEAEAKAEGEEAGVEEAEAETE